MEILMAQLAYTVNYTIFVDDTLVNEVQQMAKADFRASEICRKIMDKTGYSLHTANCIRKVLTQGTSEFDILDY
jgi:hypothetical protein